MFKYYGSQLIFLVALSLLLELKVVPLFAIHGAQPDLFFILIAFYSFFIYPSRTLHFAVLLGIVRDFFAGTFFGLETLAYGLSGLMLWVFVMKVEKENLYNQGMLLFLFSFTNLVIFGILALIVTESSLTIGQVIVKALSISVYTCLVGPFAFELIRHFLKINQRDLFERSAHSRD